MQINVNGQVRSIEVDADKPLLWVLREDLAMTGTKFGCGVAACGACTVMIDGEAVRSCSLPVSAAEGLNIITIEGIAPVEKPDAIQQAWLNNQVPQCGYCQSGMIMAVKALLTKSPNPTDAEIDAAITNICRCGTYDRIRVAIKEAATQMQGA
jgi:isoquinoline 1-oxidoreductase subunit alpha